MLEAATEAEDESEYLDRLAAALGSHTNAIIRLDSPYPIQTYTCFVHAFRFTQKPEYIAIAKRGFNVVYAGPGFMAWLLQNSLLIEVSAKQATDGDLAVYFTDDGRVKHGGLYVGNERVESKWGMGHLFQHAIFEVPESYGTKVKFFKQITSSNAFGHFRRFAVEKGMFMSDLPPYDET
jgi:hypothetical protein